MISDALTNLITKIEFAMPSSRNDQRGLNQGNDRGNQGGRSNRGFAAMNKEEQREIARKGGEAVSRNREHMAEIGRRGGEASGSNRSRASQTQNQNQGLNRGSNLNSGMNSNLESGRSSGLGGSNSEENL
jgi:uncharacterized protein